MGTGAQGAVVTATSATGNAVANCPAGRFATGGGYQMAGGGNLEPIITRPVGGPPPTGWQATSGDARSVTAYVVCTP
ncbi:hypothetical protein ACFVGY_32685 [Streptomyces sp. NPDC127106]|uniref:hypothetical protein n=1 Tax=Streptomyces sp. NPDC127106 TaxID=3345360 RepID=UPI003637852B